MLTHDLFNSIEVRYAGGGPAGSEGTVRDLGDEETLRIVYRDGDLHLYVVPDGQVATAGASLELHVLHTRITVLSQRQVTFDGFAVPAQAGRPYPRATVTLRHRADLTPHADRLGDLGRRADPIARASADPVPDAVPAPAPDAGPPASHAGFTRITAAGGVSGLELSYQWQRSVEEPPVRGTVFVDAGYLDRYARTDPATGEPLDVHDPDTVRRLAMTTHGLARPVSLSEPEVLRRTAEFTAVWDTLFAPLPGQRPVQG